MNRSLFWPADDGDGSRFGLVWWPSFGPSLLTALVACGLWAKAITQPEGDFQTGAFKQACACVLHDVSLVCTAVTSRVNSIIWSKLVPQGI